MTLDMRRFIRVACGTALILSTIIPPEAAEAAPPSPTRSHGHRKARPKPAPEPPRPRRHHARNRTALVIRRIRIIRRDIFDTRLSSENKLPYRAVNHLHFITKESVVRGQLLLKEGDRYDADLAKESERALRNILHLRNVRVIPLPVNQKTVDLLVTVQDTWTTEPQFGVSSVGSNVNMKAGLWEGNLLGYGKTASYYYRKTDGIISRTYSYDDPRLFNTSLVMSGKFADREDGTQRFLSIDKPFTSSITPWSFGGHFKNDSLQEKVLDNLGNETGRLWANSKDAGGAAAISAWSTTRKIRRPGVGYRRMDDKTTDQATGKVLQHDIYHVFETGVDLERVRFLTVNHINQYDRDEDFNLGPAFNLTAGAARKKWVPTSDNADFLSGQLNRGMSFGPSHFGLFTSQGKGKLEEGVWRAADVKADVYYYNHFQPRQTLACHAGWEGIANPGPGDQLYLGGDTGLRAYKINQFAGNKKLLANAEDRFFVLDDVMKFASLGGVVFTDTGYVWAPGKNIRLNDVKANVGAGLRIYLTRTGLGHVLRFDLSYALKRVGEQKRLVFIFGTSQAF